MREDTKKRLERVIWMRRLKIAASGLAAIGAVAAAFWFTGLEATVETHHVGGTVTAVGPYNGMSSLAIEQGLGVDVKLDDGRLAHVLALKKTNPHVGDHVMIAEHKHGSGRVTFSWK